MTVFNAVSVGVAGVAFALFWPSAAGRAAEGQLSKFQGAWLQSLSCNEVFAKGPKGIVFRKPVNIFAPAFVIAGNSLKTPQTTCRIGAVKSSGDRSVLSLACSTSVSVGDVRATLGVGADGALFRYFDENDRTGSRYERCPQ